MASSRMIVTKKRGVFMAHVCSGCGFPRVTAVLIEATAEKSYSISRSYAEQIASETAENAIQAEIKAIDTCYSTRQPLVGSHKGNGMISPGYFCNSSFRGHMSPCPKCFNLEPWQFSNAEKVMDELEVDNFPTVFTDAKEAEEWAIDKVKEHMEIIDIMRTSEKTRKDAAIKVNDSKLKIKSWLDELNSVPERDGLDQLKAELSKAEGLKPQLGVLDFKKKKVLNEKINTLQAQIKNLNDVIHRKTTPLEKRILKLGNELITTQSIAFGYSDKIASKEVGNTVSYYISPNDSPTEVTSTDNNPQPIAIEASIAPTEDIILPNKFITDDKPVFCRKCGFKLLDNSSFCTKCGTKVD